MSIEKLANKIIDTDVLVVGGGIAGCPAAAKAAEHGLKVTLVDKAQVDRSGSAAQGIDHYAGPYPRGMTPESFMKIWDELGGKDRAFYNGVIYNDPTRMYRQYANGTWAIEELEKLGVTMRWYDGELRPVRIPGREPFLRINWSKCKPQMAAALTKRGVNVLNRTMIVDLLTNKGAVVGATAVNTRSGEFLVIKAKATIMATAACSRVYDPETPVPWKYKFRYHWCPSSVSGDGWAMVYRAGAELANMEQAGRGYRYRDDSALSQGNRSNEGVEADQLTWDGEPMWGRDYRELEQQGKTPIYVSLVNVPEDFQKRIEVAFVDERMVSLKIAEDRGFDPKTHWYETMDDRPNQLHVPPGINSDAEFKTNIKGLYAIGDCVAGCHDIANAAASGFLVGDEMGTFISAAREPVIDEAQLESQRQTALAPLSVKDGTEAMELECAIRYICNRYVGVYKAEGKMREGLRRLGSLRREFLPKLMAKNPHYLMRCLETRNLMDVAELHIQSSMARKETRGHYHFRLDYTEIDPALDDLLLYQRLENNKPVIDFRKVTPMDMSRRETR